MSNEYTFWDMLRDTFFNGNKVSNRHQNNDDEHEPSWGGLYHETSSPSVSRDFDPSDSAGDAFRSVFGDDNSS